MPTTYQRHAAPTALANRRIHQHPEPAPGRRLIPYQPNTPLWSDDALKMHYLAVPNNGGTIHPEQQIAFTPTGGWTFPAGTVFVKTFDLQHR